MALAPPAPRLLPGLTAALFPVSTSPSAAFLRPAPPRRAMVLAALALLHVGGAALLWRQAVVLPRPTAEAPLVVRLLHAPSAPAPVPAPTLPRPRVPLPEAAPAALSLPSIVIAPAPSPMAANDAPNAPAASPAPAAPAAAAASAAAPALPPATPRQIPPSALQYRVLPDIVYPNASRRLREQGLAVVAVLVDAEGQPRQVLVQQSSGFERLDRAAVAGIWRARFQPPVEHGQPVSGWARIPVPFELEP